MPGRYPQRTRTTRTYADRDAALRSIGYIRYSNYLRSDLWAQIRLSALEVHGTQCKLCPAEFNTLHHLNYSRATLLGHDLNGIVPLCRECHTLVEFTPAGRKRTLQQSLDAYSKLFKEWVTIQGR